MRAERGCTVKDCPPCKGHSHRAPCMHAQPAHAQDQHGSTPTAPHRRRCSARGCWNAAGIRLLLFFCLSCNFLLYGSKLGGETSKLLVQVRHTAGVRVLRLTIRGLISCCDVMQWVLVWQQHGARGV